jgi:hypothetical protein
MAASDRTPVKKRFDKRVLMEAAIDEATRAERSHDAAGHSANVLPQPHEVISVANEHRRITSPISSRLRCMPSPAV